MSTRANRARAEARVSRRARNRIEQQRKARQRRLLYFGSAVAVALIVVATLILANLLGDDTDDLPRIREAAVTIDPSIPREGRVIGDPNAPITLIEWGDYQCPGCGYVALNFTPQLIQDYVATGKIKFEYRDFPFLDLGFANAKRNGRDLTTASGESIRAAEAAAEAAAQGKFWEFHEALFSNQHGENKGAFSDGRLREIASKVGLDMAAFDEALESRKHIAEVVAMYDEGERIGISSTPTYEINGQLFQVQSYEDLVQRIEAALAG